MIRQSSRAMTQARLMELRAAVQQGMSKQDIIVAYRVSDKTLLKYKVFSDEVVDVEKILNEREISPVTLDLAEQMIRSGESAGEVIRRTGISWRGIYKLLAERGLRLLSPTERAERDREKNKKLAANARMAKRSKKRPIEREAAHGGRLISRTNQPPEWAPRTDMTSLEMAVTQLRQRYAPVCAESTIQKPFDIPWPYDDNTLFRVGTLRGVSAEHVLEMARGCERECRK